MKKIIFTIAAGCFLLWSATSCTDESLVTEQNGLSISGNISTNSRVSLVDEDMVTQTKWEVNDAIGLYSSTQQNVPYKATKFGKTTDFVQASSTTIESEEEKKVRAYFPYSDKVQGSEVPLPYTIGQQSQNKPSTFMYSETTIKNNRADFTFKHLFSYLKITVNTQQYRDNLINGCILDGGGIRIASNEPISVEDATLNIETMTITHKKTDNQRMFYYADDLNVNANKDITYLIPILPQTETANVSVEFFYPQQGNTGYVYTIKLVSKKAPQGGFQAGCVYEFDTVDRSKQQKALSDFYEATGGANWNGNDNWLSDKPLNDWFGLNTYTTGLGYVQTMDLSYNNLRGTLPSSFAKLMDNAINLDISQNYLSGAIPEEVKKHDKWNSFGWLIIPQQTRQGGGFKLTESNLYAPDDTKYDLLTNTSKSLSNIFSENKLTQVIYYNEPTINNIIGRFSSDRVNHHLDYVNKGLGTIIYTSADEGDNNDEFIKTLKEKYGTIKGMHWMYNVPPFTAYSNYAYVFDSQGQLVHLVDYSNTSENESVISTYDDFLRAELGEPEEHDEFSFDFYTSTDYSHDGEMFVLQRATQGNGVNLVLLGEGFVDKDMERGGKYEQKMIEATEKLFSLEPYTSLRNRFNVYGVKVVSPTSEFTKGADKRINEDNNTAFQYAINCDGLSQADRLMVVVVYNTESNAGRSYCSLYSDGSFVAYNMGAIDNTIIHEVGGHGIAKLYDEYVERGYEETSIPNDKIYLYENFYWKWDWGWYKNIDYRNSSNTINWAHMLADSRYAKDDLGIFEGAATYGKGCYRSSYDSMMRSNISWFNAPSRELIYKAVMTLSEGKEWEYNYETFVNFDKKNIQNYSRSVKTGPTKEEIRQIREQHIRPKLLQGTWRDALNSSTALTAFPLLK